MNQKRYALKIAGASGQGINVIGEILNKGLKRSGYFTFAYREYPSLIKGGHATYQIDISNITVLSSKKKIDLLIVLNKQSTQWHIDELVQDSTILHDIDNPRISRIESEAFAKNNTKLVYIPAFKLSKEQGGNELTANIVMLGSLWKILKLDESLLKEIVHEAFKDKPAILEMDLLCAAAGYNYNFDQQIVEGGRLIKPDEISFEEKLKLHTNNLISTFEEINATNALYSKKSYLLSGNELLSLGSITAGVRIYYSYPMTPSSSILTFLADHAEDTGMIVKQVEDEITAAAMTIGSMHMGTRALTGTSGGGFDLMTEHVSLAAMTEIPFVCILGQRPGPATGLPTWTTQGDLQLAIFSSHGEFSRCVIAPKDGEDCFYAIQEAFNIAEEYQIPVIVLSDKLIAESVYLIENLDTDRIEIKRGLVEDLESLNNLKSADRYKFTESGVSKRWLPGRSQADFNANSDEHDEEGNVTEDAETSSKMMAKRLKKSDGLTTLLPEPEIYINNISTENAKTVIKIISWGSTFGVIHDTMKVLEAEKIRVENLHFKYLWPLKTETLEKFIEENTIIIEGNHNSELAELIRMKTGLEIKHKILRWDGRPFFLDELCERLIALTKDLILKGAT